MSDHHAATDEHALDHSAGDHDAGHDADAHGHDAGHGHEAGHGIVALGPIDWTMWGVGVLGVIVGLIVTAGLVVATAFSFTA